MIRVTLWYENIQESGKLPKEFKPSGMGEENLVWFRQMVEDSAAKIKEVYPKGLMETLAEHLRACDNIQVTSVTMDMPEYGLPQELLENTDVLVWWAHLGHEAVPDRLVERIQRRVWMGMGLISLHSSHPSKIMCRLLGTSGTLRWRDGDFCRIWNINPAHPIAQGIPEYIDLEEEEMYGEPFDIPAPEEIVFLSWFRGGEVLRSGCTWHRGCGKIFYFQPGHETNTAYHNPYVKKIIENAVRWAAPVVWRKQIECSYIEVSPESEQKNARRDEK